MPSDTRKADTDARGRATTTSYDVALRAGVSQSAVSRCFRPGSSIAPATRQRVLDAATALGYYPNAFASGLITKRSNLVAVLISNLTNLSYPEVLAELTSRLSDEGIRVLLFTLQRESDVGAILDQVWRYRVDGAIVAAALSRDQLGAFAQRRVPVVLYNRLGEDTLASSVCCDMADGVRVLVDRLDAAGHRRYGVIAGPEDSYVGRERVRGARERLDQLGRQTKIVAGGFDYRSGFEAMRTLFEVTGGAIDAVICANDQAAIGAIDHARSERGIAVPQELSVVGFDGVEPATWVSHAITTIRQPLRRMTQAAVAMLVERIADPNLGVEARSFRGELILGKSARI